MRNRLEYYFTYLHISQLNSKILWIHQKGLHDSTAEFSCGEISESIPALRAREFTGTLLKLYGIRDKGILYFFLRLPLNR